MKILRITVAYGEIEHGAWHRTFTPEIARSHEVVVPESGLRGLDDNEVSRAARAAYGVLKREAALTDGGGV
jgi:hypothetical protein